MYRFANQLHSLLGVRHALLEAATNRAVGGDPNCDQADLNLRGRALKGRNLRGRFIGHWSDVIRTVSGLWPSRLMGFRVRERPKC